MSDPNDALESNPHAIATKMAQRLAIGKLPVETYHLTDARSFKKQEIRCQEGLIHARYAALCFEHNILDTASENCNKELRNELWKSSIEYVLESLWASEGLISYPQLREMLTATGYPFKEKSPRLILKTLLDWVEESKVPILSQIDFSKMDFNDTELLTFARLGVIRGFPTSRKALKMRGKVSTKSTNDHNDYLAKIDGYKKRLIEYNIIRDGKFAQNPHALLPRKMCRMPSEFKLSLRFVEMQPLEY